VGTTHIIIGATVAKDGDASAAKLEDEKGRGIEYHGRSRRCRFLTSSLYFITQLFKMNRLAGNLLCFLLSCTLPLP
jgi:hypothetical protein